jgi:2-polyprenyl-3-methyl-5-hydroxy-6-metoxy-1,4-benzoquinol methylase
MARVDISELDFEQMIAIGNRIYSHVTGAQVAALVVIGDRLGLFEALADHGPCTGAQLAAVTSLHERYVREWADALVATGYVEVSDGSEPRRYHLTKEGVFFFGDPESPGFSVGAYQLAYGVSRNVPRLMECFASGEGIGYADSGEEVTVGVERLWAPIHEFFLEGWLQSVPGLTEKLSAPGAAIADVGCGRGRSTATLARLFPKAEVVGIDADAASVEAARALAASRGLSNVAFRVQLADEITEQDRYDFVYLFHTLHDIPEPVPALTAMGRALKADGLLLCVESSASDDPMANRGTPAEMFASVSPLFNLPVAMAAAGDGSGTILTEANVRAWADKAGLGSYEVLAITFPPPSMLHRFHALRR